MDPIDCKVKLLFFQPDRESSHITLADPHNCLTCKSGICMTICPSGVFKCNYQDNEQPMLVLYMQCIECGACRLVCPRNNIQFRYPNCGYGVCFNDGISVYPASDRP